MRIGFFEQISPNAKLVASIAAALLWLCPLAVNAGLLALVLVSLLVFVLLLWRRNQPPALMLVCATQWLQGAMKPVYAEFLGVPLWRLPLDPEHLDSHNAELACALTLVWVIVLAIGIWLGWSKSDGADFMHTVDVRTAFIVYVGWSVIVQLLVVATPAAATVALLTLSDLRFGPLYVVYRAALRSQRSKLLLIGVLGVEIMLGFLSYFSSFRVPLGVLLIALLAREPRVRWTHAVGVLAVTLSTVFLYAVWTSIKEEYRDRISRGSGAQQVSVSTDNQLHELFEIASGLDQRMISEGASRLIERIAYTDLFALTLDYVPRVRPHEDGRIWWSAIEHVLMPRVFFPNKESLANDTDIARRYTGSQITENPNTSVSIGLPAETYVDLGEWGMFVIALVLGLLYGRIYTIVSRRGAYPAFSEGLAVTNALGAFGLERSPAKALGSALSLMILAVVSSRTILPWLVTLAERFGRRKPIAPERPKLSVTRRP